MDIIKNNPILEKITALHAKRQSILKMPPEKGMEEILNAQHPSALIHAFPPEDFYFFIQEIGPDDAMELLFLASDRQWEYIIDVDCWNKDQFNQKELTLWLNRMLSVDPNRLMRLSYGEKKELLTLFLFRNIEIVIRELDTDPGEIPDDYQTDDDTYYVKIIAPPKSDDILKDFHGIRYEFLTGFIRGLSSYDHLRFQDLLHEIRCILPAELEEEQFRIRNVRLAEYGLLPFDEAVGVYQSLSIPEFLNKKLKKTVLFRADNPMAIIPHYVTNMIASDNAFATVLKNIQDNTLLFQLQMEFANLCNNLIVADQAIRKEREAIESIVKKATSFINIGIEKVLEEEEDIKNPAILIEMFPLADIFRVGYGAALHLKWEAQRFKASGWFHTSGLSLNFWGEKWLGILGGLLIKKPLFFSDYRNGKIYKEFETLKEIKTTQSILEDIIRVDHLLGRMNILLSNFIHYPFLSYKNLLLTLWVNSLLNETESSPMILAPIEKEIFKSFFSELWCQSPSTRKISDKMKESFLIWISKHTKKDVEDLSVQTAHIWESIFSEIEAEYQYIKTKHIDHRYIYHFILKGNSS